MRLATGERAGVDGDGADQHAAPPVMIGPGRSARVLLTLKPIDFRKGMDGLTRFLSDGRIEIDNNAIERTIRPQALTRKNALFAGSDGGARHWACPAALIETAKLNALDPLAHLTTTLETLAASHPISRIAELLPRAYNPTLIGDQARTDDRQ